MWTLRVTVFTIALIAAGSLSRPVIAADDRMPVPPQADIEKAEATVKDLFKAEYAKTKMADRLALGTKLFMQATESKGDPAAQYVLLREARDLAAKAGTGVAAMRAADEMTAIFALRPGEAHVAAVDALVASANTAALASPTADALLAAVDDARIGAEWEYAFTLLKGAEAVAKKANSTALTNAIKGRVKDVETLKAEADKIRDHVATLKIRPADAEANLAVGRFRFLAQEWADAMENLAKGSDEKLKAAAELDRKAAAGGTADRVAAAEAWYDLAATADATTKPIIQVRAYEWYVKAVPELAGLDKARAEKRVAELQTGAEARIDRSRMWAGIRRCVALDKLKKCDIVGGAFSQKTFEELPPTGAILIGFYYTTVSNGQYPGVVQPVYQTTRGEVLGNVYGIPEKGAKPLLVKAKPGYAVGAIYTRGGGGFDAFKPIFMRITDTGLDPNDKYEGPHIGGNGGGEGTLGGDGNFIVGVHGKVGDKGKMEALSPIIMTTTDPVKPPPKNPKKPNE
jgi:hypothetical protein